MDESKRDDLYFLVAIDDERRNYRYEIYTARNDYDMEVGYNSIQEVHAFINGWEEALNGQAFYESRKAKYAELVKLNKEMTRLLALGEQILAEKDPEKMDSLIQEMEGIL